MSQHPVLAVALKKVNEVINVIVSKLVKCYVKVLRVRRESVMQYNSVLLGF